MATPDTIGGKLNRLPLIAHAASRATLWLYAHFTFEWLFHATKPSTLSLAPPLARVVVLLAAPLAASLIVASAAALLAAFDARRRASRPWLAAIVPGLIAATLLLVAADNFARTVFRVGLDDSEGVTRGALLAAVIALAAFMIHREAGRLAQPSRRGVLVAATLVVVSLATFALVAWERGEKSEVRPEFSATGAMPNVLIVGIDGLSATDLSPYGAPPEATPAIGGLAARGIVFENAFSNAGRTYGSLISMLGGRLPTETHILFPPLYLTGDVAVDHMPALLRRHGYTTAQIGMRHYADASDWNMRGGFDVINGRVQSRMTTDRSDGVERLRRYQRELGERVTDRVFHVTFIRRMEDAQAFLASKGTRSPYFSDDRRLRLAREFLESRRQPWLLHIHLLDTHCCRGEREELVRSADQSVARLVQLLEDTRQMERTMIILHSDHTPSWSTLGRIPLILVDPATRGGVRIRENAQLADVAPTILAAAAIDRPAWMSGAPLLSRLEPMRPIYSLVELAQTALSGPEMKVIQDSRPPLYGAISAAVVVCDQFVKYTFASNRLSEGRVRGHTAPCSGEDLQPRARSLLREQLLLNGYPAPPADAVDSLHVPR